MPGREEKEQDGKWGKMDSRKKNSKKTFFLSILRPSGVLCAQTELPVRCCYCWIKDRRKSGDGTAAAAAAQYLPAVQSPHNTHAHVYNTTATAAAAATPSTTKMSSLSLYEDLRRPRKKREKRDAAASLVKSELEHRLLFLFSLSLHPPCFFSV